MASELVRSASVVPDVLRADPPQPRAALPQQEQQASPERPVPQFWSESMILLVERAWWESLSFPIEPIPRV
jgi:hypothetical protein